MKSTQKRKALFVILTVSALTLYNILPTIFFYSNNLKGDISKNRAAKISTDIAKRVNKLEKESTSWIRSYCKLLQLKPSKISFKESSPDSFSVTFPSSKDARTFRSHMLRAGNLIPFFPKRMLPSEDTSMNKGGERNDHLDPNTVVLKREIPIHFNLKDINNYFSFSEMYNNDGSITADYREVLNERILEISKAATLPSTAAVNLEKALNNVPISQKLPYFLSVAETLLNYKSIFSKNKELQNRFYSSVFQSNSHSPAELYDACLNGFRESKDYLLKEKVTLKDTIEKESYDKEDLSIPEVASLKNLKYDEENLLKGLSLLTNKKHLFLTKTKRIEVSDIKSILTNNKIQNTNIFTLSTGSNNPVLSTLEVNLNEKQANIQISQDLLDFDKATTAENKKKIHQLIYDEIARIKAKTNEHIDSYGDMFTLDLSSLQNAKSFISLNLKVAAEEKLKSINSLIKNEWTRSSDALKGESYSIISYDEYNKLDQQNKHFNLVLYSPILDSKSPPEGFKNGSVYVIGKDLMLLHKEHSKKEYTEESANLYKDITSLNTVLGSSGMHGFSGGSYPFSNEFKDDIIFEMNDFSGALLAATREKWEVSGGGKSAILEFSDVRNRILTENDIENKEHADLLKWKDDYNTSQVNPNSEGYMSIPSPTKSAFFSNIALSTSKYFRGDERKILHWGLDLNGGSTVRVALKDKQNKPVTSEEDLNQGVNELYRRVNKMGVSDVTIRKEGSFITLDFPATQSLSASELITSSSMTFHMINEKFTLYNTKLAASVNKFLQEIWNEGMVTNKTDVGSLNQIACNHLYGDALDFENPIPRSDSGRILLENGLHLVVPETTIMNSNFNDKLSKVAVLEGENYREWGGKANPLMIVFNNYALEGAALQDVHSGYDPSSGNYLSFAVKSTITKSDGQYSNPQEILHSWTSAFSTAQMSNGEYSEPTNGNGWRLAAILNNRIISMPRLQDALKGNGRITGSFTQKEVGRLAADLRAGSLTYTPEIISETTISPELGTKERNQGIFATCIAFVAVLAIMIGYYRFAGIIASVAVIFNILIIWATLQNLGASLTLAGIAGIILTIGMAVDANVLIFERIREENEIHNNLGKAIASGYKKAFSAIFDSNITTIIAALILLNFDAGPVKGFALTLIIGIASSMFTALYMTRTFFNFWLKKDKKQSLKMLNLIPSTGLKFMKYGKVATMISVFVIMVGGLTLYKQKATLFGMDFTGGMTLELEVAKSDQPLPAKDLVENAFIAAGMTTSEFSIRELQNPNSLKIYLSNALNNPGKSFANLEKKQNFSDITYTFEKNSRLNFLVTLLQKSGVQLTEKSLNTLDKNFSNISGQMSETMRNNAIFGLGLALISILIYITIRFEFSYAISATIGLTFDLLLTLALLGIFKMIGLPLSIDLHTIAALMTIIGYSLNDTIIVFDRVREDLKVKKSINLREVIDLSLNRTLSRTLLTSLTTLVVLLSLVILGGKSIFGFSFLMMLGVIIGTLSTLFISSSFLLLFKGKESRKLGSASIIAIPS